MTRFFSPAPSFFAWAKKFLRNQYIFEVGAGDGHTSRGLRENGLKGVAFDLYPDEDVFHGDGTTYPFISGTTVLLCRPCHGDFVWLTIKRAFERGVTTLVYVGLPKNIKRDLGSFRKHFRLMLSDAGSDGEKVWVWDMRARRDQIDVALVQFGKEASWHEDGGDRWINQMGGWRPKHEGDVVLERTELIDSDWQSLDWTRTVYYKEDGDYGWLSPEGKFYACDYAGHGDVAFFIIKKDVSALEDEGWVRVDGPGGGSNSTFRFMAYHYSNRLLTNAQTEWLKSRGHEIGTYMLPEDPAEDKARAEKYIKYSEELTGKKIKVVREGD